jgi:hypothetical protein
MTEFETDLFDRPQRSDRSGADPAPWEELDELGEDEVPTIILYIVAALLIVSFTLYLVVGGGHNHFH